MPMGEFNHVQQTEGGNDCGIACAAMIAGVSLEKAASCSPKPLKKHYVKDIRLIINKCGNDAIVMSKIFYKIPIIFETINEFQVFFDKIIKINNKSFLIRSVSMEENGHFLLYDVKKNMINDPLCSRPKMIVEFINEYFDKKFIEFYLIKQQKFRI